MYYRKVDVATVRQKQLASHLGLLTAIDEEEAGLEDTPQLGPALQGAAHLQPVGEDDDGLVLERGEQLPLHPLLLPGVALPLGLVRLLPVDRGAGRRALETRKNTRLFQCGHSCVGGYWDALMRASDDEW